MLDAQLVQQADLADDQEVLIVTLVNSAVDNFAQRIQLFLKAASAARHELPCAHPARPGA